MASNYTPKNIEGILKMSGFAGIKVFPQHVTAMATDEQGQHFTFWSQYGRLWLEIDDDPKQRLSIAIDTVHHDNLDHAFQGLIDFYLESERELEEEGY